MVSLVCSEDVNMVIEICMYAHLKVYYFCDFRVYKKL